jgi:simple sugar transport system ATP-binding protein
LSTNTRAKRRCGERFADKKNSIAPSLLRATDIRKSFGPVAALSGERIASAEIEKIGIDVGDIERSVMTLSGGERQSVAIARAIYFGAKILVLDEPTPSLGLKEAAVVPGCINRAKEHNIGVVFVTHNANHAFLIGDSFEILRRGNVSITFHRGELTREQLMTQMTGDEDLSLLGPLPHL